MDEGTGPIGLVPTFMIAVATWSFISSQRASDK
jgi:hypothetical protein